MSFEKRQSRSLRSGVRQNRILRTMILLKRSAYQLCGLGVRG